MAHVSLRKANVHIPIYDSHALRLIRLPSLGAAKVGTGDVSQSTRNLVMHAVIDLDLELSSGDRVCLIGHNGAGKTTLLRLIAGIYPPTRGYMEAQGKIFALLGSSMALNPDATGRENIRLIADLYDWPMKQYDEIARDIEEFTELGDYLSLPTRTYSAGMQARLAFAMGTAQAPDILLMDEAIGAGDAHFQTKAHDRVHRLVNQAKIVILASHSVELCRALCNKGLILAKGRRQFFGEIEEAFQRYATMV
jgi:ABC-2 type transport system ATP-binding protein/lipopolysaccharide transport system ATP-binding protein